MDPVLLVLGFLAARKHLAKQPGAAPDKKPTGPVIPREVVEKVAAIVSTRLTAGTSVPSARIQDEVTKLLRDNPNLTAKLVMVYQAELRGESADAEQQ